jgi:hypothetical protein
MYPRVSFRSAISDPALLQHTLQGATWATWAVVLLATLGEKLTEDEREIFKAVTGREREPLEAVAELVAVIGRRGGKSRALAVLAAYIAALCDHPSLAAGEVGDRF